MESRFCVAPAAMTVGEIVQLTGAQASPDADLSRRIANVAPLDLAGPDDVSFVESRKYLKALKSTRAGACLMAPNLESAAPAGTIVLKSRDAQRAFTIVSRKMHAAALNAASIFGGKGVAPGAIVASTARIDATATVDPGAVIGPYAVIGPGTVIGATAVIGAHVHIGSDCSIGAGCTITHSTVGDRVVVHPGCRIGQDGFGYVPGANGHMKVPQLGAVVIHNDVEIGASTTIDRGGLRDTVIGEGTKIDNLVQIGHNVVIGRHCILVGQCGISGSVTIGDFAMLGGAVGVAPHTTIGKGARLAARAGVMRDVPAGETWGGYPAQPSRRWLRQQITLDRLAAPTSSIESPSISDPDHVESAPATATSRPR